MPLARQVKWLGAAALCSAVLLGPALALAEAPEDKAIATRQGYMKLVVWEAGPLFGMAKGEMAYDAEAAKTRAANLKMLAAYPVGELFIAGTSNADRPGKTRSLPDIWAQPDKFATAMDDWRAAVAALDGKVGNGQAELAAAVAAMGKTCGGCHKPFRAEEF